jgi:hypothetical protein
MKSHFKKVRGLGVLFLSVSFALGAGGCANEKMRNRAKEAAARFWQDKAYPGKSFDVQVIEAEKTDDGMYRVKGIVDGETRVGSFNPETENFSEGYYSLAHERSKRIAELEQESKYWKEKAENFEKELYKLKVKMNLLKGDDADPDSKKAEKSKKE